MESKQTLSLSPTEGTIYETHPGFGLHTVMGRTPQKHVLSNSQTQTAPFLFLLPLYTIHSFEQTMDTGLIRFPPAIFFKSLATEAHQPPQLPSQAILHELRPPSSWESRIPWSPTSSAAGGGEGHSATDDGW